MLGTFVPIRAGGAGRLLGALSLLLVGAFVSAGMLGLLLGLLGQELALRSAAGMLALAAACLLFAAQYAGWRASFRPMFRREIGRHWLTLLPLPLAALVYGLGLGPGCLYRITHPGYYVLFAGCIVLAQPPAAALTLGTYGAARAATILVTSLLSRNGPQLDELQGLLCSERRRPDLSRTAAMAVLAIWLAADALLFPSG